MIIYQYFVALLMHCKLKLMFLDGTEEDTKWRNCGCDAAEVGELADINLNREIQNIVILLYLPLSSFIVKLPKMLIKWMKK